MSTTEQEKQPKTKSSKFMQPKHLSKELAAVIGSGPYPRTEVTKLLWNYIKSHGLQKKTMIEPDDLLAQVFGKTTPVNMFELPRLIGPHLS